jgi:hypothetical protein
LDISPIKGKESFSILSVYQLFYSTSSHITKMPIYLAITNSAAPLPLFKENGIPSMQPGEASDVPVSAFPVCIK